MAASNAETSLQDVGWDDLEDDAFNAAGIGEAEEDFQWPDEQDWPVGSPSPAKPGTASDQPAASATTVAPLKAESSIQTASSFKLQQVPSISSQVVLVQQQLAVQSLPAASPPAAAAPPPPAVSAPIAPGPIASRGTSSGSEVARPGSVISASSSSGQPSSAARPPAIPGPTAARQESTNSTWHRLDSGFVASDSLLAGMATEAEFDDALADLLSGAPPPDEPAPPPASTAPPPTAAEAPSNAANLPRGDVPSAAERQPESFGTTSSTPADAAVQSSSSQVLQDVKATSSSLNTQAPAAAPTPSISHNTEPPPPPSSAFAVAAQQAPSPGLGAGWPDSRAASGQVGSHGVSRVHTAQVEVMDSTHLAALFGSDATTGDGGLFGEAADAGADLFSAPAANAGDALFGGPAAAPTMTSKELFGGAAGAADDAVFGAATAAPFPAAEAAPFGAPAAGDVSQLFGGPAGDDDDALFGGAVPAAAAGDLFGGVTGGGQDELFGTDWGAAAQPQTVAPSHAQHPGAPPAQATQPEPFQQWQQQQPTQQWDQQQQPWNQYTAQQANSWQAAQPNPQPWQQQHTPQVPQVQQESSWQAGGYQQPWAPDVQQAPGMDDGTSFFDSVDLQPQTEPAPSGAAFDQPTLALPSGPAPPMPSQASATQASTGSAPIPIGTIMGQESIDSSKPGGSMVTVLDQVSSLQGPSPFSLQPTGASTPASTPGASDRPSGHDTHMLMPGAVPGATADHGNAAATVQAAQAPAQTGAQPTQWAVHAAGQGSDVAHTATAAQPAPVPGVFGTSDDVAFFNESNGIDGPMASLGLPADQPETQPAAISSAIDGWTAASAAADTPEYTTAHETVSGAPGQEAGPPAAWERYPSIRTHSVPPGYIEKHTWPSGSLDAYPLVYSFRRGWHGEQPAEETDAAGAGADAEQSAGSTLDKSLGEVDEGPPLQLSMAEHQARQARKFREIQEQVMKQSLGLEGMDESQLIQDPDAFFANLDENGLASPADEPAVQADADQQQQEALEETAAGQPAAGTQARVTSLVAEPPPVQAAATPSGWGEAAAADTGGTASGNGAPAAATATGSATPQVLDRQSAGGVEAASGADDGVQQAASGVTSKNVSMRSGGPGPQDVTEDAAHAWADYWARTYTDQYGEEHYAYYYDLCRQQYAQQVAAQAATPTDAATSTPGREAAESTAEGAAAAAAPAGTGGEAGAGAQHAAAAPVGGVGAEAGAQADGQLMDQPRGSVDQGFAVSGGHLPGDAAHAGGAAEVLGQGVQEAQQPEYSQPSFSQPPVGFAETDAAEQVPAYGAADHVQQQQAGGAQAGGVDHAAAPTGAGYADLFGQSGHDQPDLFNVQAGQAGGAVAGEQPVHAAVATAMDQPGGSTQEQDQSQFNAGYAGYQYDQQAYAGYGDSAYGNASNQQAGSQGYGYGQSQDQSPYGYSPMSQTQQQQQPFGAYGQASAHAGGYMYSQDYGGGAAGNWGAQQQQQQGQGYGLGAVNTQGYGAAHQQDGGYGQLGAEGADARFSFGQQQQGSSPQYGMHAASAFHQQQPGVVPGHAYAAGSFTHQQPPGIWHAGSHAAHATGFTSTGSGGGTAFAAGGGGDSGNLYVAQYNAAHKVAGVGSLVDLPVSSAAAKMCPNGRPAIPFVSFCFGGKVLVVHPPKAGGGADTPTAGSAQQASMAAAAAFPGLPSQTSTLVNIRVASMVSTHNLVSCLRSLGIGTETLTPAVHPGSPRGSNPNKPHLAAAETLTSSHTLLSAFPGPLGPTTNKDKLIKYITDRWHAFDSEDPHAGQAPLPLGVLLWRVLSLQVRHGPLPRLNVPISGAKGRDDVHSPEHDLIQLLARDPGPAKGSKGGAGQGLTHRHSHFGPDGGRVGMGWPGGEPSLGVEEVEPFVCGVPDQANLAAAAAQVQKLVVDGQKVEAVKVASGAGLWSVALLLASTCPPPLFAETATAMCQALLLPGSPLNTAGLLLAGRPDLAVPPPHMGSAAPVKPDTALGKLTGGLVGGGDKKVGAGLAPGFRGGQGTLLSTWRHNLAVLISLARGAPDVEAIIRLGDQLAAEAAEPRAAHLCYLIASVQPSFHPPTTSFHPAAHGDAGGLGMRPSMSGTVARFCLLGVDHVTAPRTYANLLAIQRTELMEYALLGAGQSTAGEGQAAVGGIIPALIPYKLVYAQMLAEAGKLAEALSYCSVLETALKERGGAALPAGYAQLLMKETEDFRDRLATYANAHHIALNTAESSSIGRIGRFLDSTLTRLFWGGNPDASTTKADSEAEQHGMKPREGAAATFYGGASAPVVPMSANPGQGGSGHPAHVSRAASSNNMSPPAHMMRGSHMGEAERTPSNLSRHARQYSQDDFNNSSGAYPPNRPPLPGGPGGGHGPWGRGPGHPASPSAVSMHPSPPASASHSVVHSRSASNADMHPWTSPAMHHHHQPSHLTPGRPSQDGNDPRGRHNRHSAHDPGAPHQHTAPAGHPGHHPDAGPAPPHAQSQQQHAQQGAGQKQGWTDDSAAGGGAGSQAGSRAAQQSAPAPVNGSPKSSDHPTNNAANGGSGGGGGGGRKGWGLLSLLGGGGGAAAAAPAAPAAAAASKDKKGPKQAHLGEEATFYYDKEKKRYVFPGEPEPEEPPPPAAPPTSFAYTHAPGAAAEGGAPPTAADGARPFNRTESSSSMRSKSLRSKYVDTFNPSGPPSTTGASSQHTTPPSSMTGLPALPPMPPGNFLIPPIAHTGSSTNLYASSRQPSVDAPAVPAQEAAAQPAVSGESKLASLGQQPGAPGMGFASRVSSSASVTSAAAGVAGGIAPVPALPAAAQPLPGAPRPPPPAGQQPGFPGAPPAPATTYPPATQSMQSSGPGPNQAPGPNQPAVAAAQPVDPMQARNSGQVREARWSQQEGSLTEGGSVAPFYAHSYDTLLAPTQDAQAPPAYPPSGPHQQQQAPAMRSSASGVQPGGNQYMAGGPGVMGPGGHAHSLSHQSSSASDARGPAGGGYTGPGQQQQLQQAPHRNDSHASLGSHSQQGLPAGESTAWQHRASGTGQAQQAGWQQQQQQPGQGRLPHSSSFQQPWDAHQGGQVGMGQHAHHGAAHGQYMYGQAGAAGAPPGGFAAPPAVAPGGLYPYGHPAGGAGDSGGDGLTEIAL